MAFQQISPLELNESAFRLIGKEWMLITAGTEGDYNTMTASWGGFGELWFKPVTFCFVRPQRYTFEFVEKYEHFTLSFFPKEHRGALKILGAKSGRDGDKVTEAGLTAVFNEGCTWFEEARLVLQCKKLYFQDLVPENILEDKLHSQCYPEKDYHRMYIGEVLKVLSR